MGISIKTTSVSVSAATPTPLVGANNDRKHLCIVVNGVNPATIKFGPHLLARLMASALMAPACQAAKEVRSGTANSTRQPIRFSLGPLWVRLSA